MKNRYKLMTNAGKNFEPSLKVLSKKLAAISYTDLARWKNKSIMQAGNHPFLAHASRLGFRSIADVPSQLWKMWINGEIKLPDDVDMLPDIQRL